MFVEIKSHNVMVVGGCGLVRLRRGLSSNPNLSNMYAE